MSGEEKEHTTEAFNALDRGNSPASATTGGEATGWSDSGASSSGHDLLSFGSPICDISDGTCCGAGGGSVSDRPLWSPLVGSRDTPEYDSGEPDFHAAPQHDPVDTVEEEGWGADSEDEEEEDEEGSDRDKFLDDFARVLDGSSSSCDGGNEDDEEEEEEEEGGGGVVDTAGDASVARAMQEEEWRRSPPPQRSCYDKTPSSSDIGNDIGGGSCGGGGGRTINSCTSSSTCGITTTGRIYDSARSGTGAGAGRSLGAASFGASFSSSSFSAADAVAHALGPSAKRRAEGAQLPPLTPRDYEKIGRQHAVGPGGAASEIARTGAGKRKKRVPSPPVWPPGGLKEGEGLPLDDLPDEILEKVAAFRLMPRCVSKRFQRIRVKIVRQRVVAALESSAKLPTDTAEDIEGAIFALSGRFVGKAYKAKARELSFNLRAGKNDPLREAVFSGALLSWVLVRMSSDELAPLSVRLERERIARKRIREVTSSRDSPNHTVTERFTCPECGHERTQYRTWRRKAVVDRIRVIIQCLQCRHSWEL